METTAPSRIPVMRPWLGEDEAVAAAEAVRSGWVAQGPRVGAFEEAFSTRVDGRPCVAVSSCTTALHLALVALGVGPGDEVVVPSLSFIATANVVRYVGATPVFADVELTTLNLTAGTVGPLLRPATRAVILVDQAGAPADVPAMRALCDPLGVAVIEDAACAIGSSAHGRPTGTLADLAAFSFHPRKVVTCGEGGMLVAADTEVAARARRLREHGMSVSAADRHASGSTTPEQYLETGFNFRMTDIQAAVGLVQLGKLTEMVDRRRLLAARYRSMLPGMTMAADPPYGTSNFQSFWILLPDGCEQGVVLRRLEEDGISARRGIMAAHLEPAYADHPVGELPVTERVTRGSIILPLFHQLAESDQDRVVESLAGVLGGAR